MALQDISGGGSGLTEDEIDQVNFEAPHLIPNCVAAILIGLRPEFEIGAKSVARTAD